MTHEKYNNEQCNGKQRTAAFRIKSVCGVGYSKDAVLTPEQIDALNARFGGGEKTTERKPTTFISNFQTIKYETRNTAQRPRKRNIYDY